MIRTLPIALLVLAASFAQAADAERTVAKATTALHEIMAVPLKGIPESLLADAEAVAIFPSVLKVGFVAGVERGRGVVTIRDADRNWGAPRFLTITAGSVGWQIGASATDLVLVFKTRKSVDNLLEGKFKIGADIAAAAGPVGRRAEAATDGQLQAEIYSYSRSRGLFAGASIDGAIIQLDSDTESGYYRAGLDGRAIVPESATKLVGLIAAYSKDSQAAAQPAPVGAAPVGAAPVVEEPMERLRKHVVATSDQLSRVLDDSWKRHLALPADIFAEAGQPSKAALESALARYDNVARDPKYSALAKRAEFQAARLALQQYAEALDEQPSIIPLPAPPDGGR
jgi:lipid-binding SYLF domain-containing protein